MNESVQFLVRKVIAEDNRSAAAAAALWQIVEKKPASIAPFVSQLKSLLQTPQFRLRAQIVRILAYANNNDVLDAEFAAIRRMTNDELLAVDDDWGTVCCSIFWAFNTSGDHGRDDNGHLKVASFFSSTICDTSRHAQIRSEAVEQLITYTEEHHEDARSRILFTPKLFEACQELSEHSSRGVYSNAMKLLSHIGHRMTSAPPAKRDAASVDPTTREKRIDFQFVSPRSLVVDHARTRFANVHPMDFETLMARVFREAGFEVEQTQYIGDFGADLLIQKGGVKTAVQLKRYTLNNKVGVGDVNQVIGARQYYNCGRALIVTTSAFTPAASELASKTDVVMWDWQRLAVELQKLYKIAF